MDILRQIKIRIYKYQIRYELTPNFIEIGIELFEQIKMQQGVIFHPMNKHFIYGIETNVNTDNPYILKVGYLESTTLLEEEL